jgi:ABC-type multidrug transport system fused ATPase/permease subunit
MNDPQTSSNRDEALSIAHPLRRLEADFLRPYRGKIALGLLGLLVQAVLLLPVPLLQGSVVDKLVALAGATGGAGGAVVPTKADVAWAIGLALCGTIALHLARSALSWWTAALMGRIGQETVVSIRAALHRKLMRLPMAYFDAQ